MRRIPRGNETTFEKTIELDGEDVEVSVRAIVTPPTRPTIRMDPDDCDPGDPGEFELVSVVRTDTHEDITDKVDADLFESDGLEQAADDAEAAYEDAMEARAEARRERDYYGERDYDDRDYD